MVEKVAELYVNTAQCSKMMEGQVKRMEARLITCEKRMDNDNETKYNTIEKPMYNRKTSEDLTKSSGKVKLVMEHDRAEKVLNLAKKFRQLTNAEKMLFLRKHVTNNDLKIIYELVLNFSYGRLPPDCHTYQRLKRHKALIYRLASKKTSWEAKRQILSSNKGLKIVKLLFPLVESNHK